VAAPQGGALFQYQSPILVPPGRDKYILNQPEHHRKVTFTEEYETFMKFYQKTL
jgi:hypothetical protein